ncbi:hypothetical protein HanHA300_Chr05g0175641 [Helianthus annuus]|nr:hypothetical protein HanHA300_Chr05g0175641 [Helianthus annuus]KAJ0747182.1 hypothetical protein HanOQP8_Chr05g0186511 [Helianthus annuus]
MPDEAALNAVLPGGKGHLGALGDPAATGVPKETMLKFGDKRQRKKKTHEPISVPSLVPEVACILRTRLRKSEDYVVVSDTLEGLGVPGGSAAGGGSTVGTKPVDVKKRKGDAPVAGGEKAHRLRKTRPTAVLKPKPAVSTAPSEEPVSLFATPPSSPKVVDVEVQKKGGEDPSIEVGDGKPKSPVLEKTSDSTAAGTGVEDQPSIQPEESELEFYYRSYAAERVLDYHHPPWNVLQGDDVTNDPSACREILRGLGTPFETARARGLTRQNWQNQLASMLVGSSIIANAVMEDYNVLARREEETIRLQDEAEAMVKAAREGVEQLEREKAAFEKLKQNKRWAASAGLEQVRSLAKLLSDERKLWKEACARENEKLFHVRQELNNLKAANAALVKEKAAAEVAVKKAETRGATALKEAEARAA